MNHGSRGSYNAGCRCQPCVEANRSYHAERRQAARERRTLKVDFTGLYSVDRYIADVPPSQHGKHGTYTNHFCRCVPCTEAAGAYMARRRQAVTT